jgi:predicted AlkP superfamily pyrophosphatase or phosphodiesterase
MLLRFACTALLLAASASAADRNAHVIVVSIDGLPAYALDDPKLPMPTLRMMAEKGAVAKGMRTINPSVTWPCHTAMVTGVNATGHQVVFNGRLMKSTPTAAPRVEPWRDKAEMVHAPTVYDVAYKAGLTTAQVDWVAITNPGTITWEFPEVPNVKGALVQEMIAAGEVTEADISGFFKSNPVWRDLMWAKAASFITRKHKPNLGLYHFLNLDGTHHTYGPRTPAGNTAMGFADTLLKQVVDSARAAGIFDRTTFLVLSDHGFKPVKKYIRGNVATRQAGIEGVSVIPEGGSALIYVHDAAERDRLVPKLKELFARTEGVARVYSPAEFAELGLPTRQQSDQGPDLVLTPKPTYGFGGGSEGALLNEPYQSGAHGFPSSDPDMNAVFIACGRGIKPGVKLDVIDNVDVAPTVAALLGLKMEGISGKAVAAALR